ncbi:MAG: hypothetical protein ACYC0F_19400 [Rhodanobacter sp.]
MSDEKVVGIEQAARRRERLKEVAAAFVEDVAEVKVRLRRSLAPVGGQEVFNTLERMEAAAKYWYLGQDNGPRPSPVGGPVAERYRLGMFSILLEVAAKLTENLAAEGLTDKELMELAVALEFGAEQIRNYMAAVDIERQIEEQQCERRKASQAIKEMED